MPNWIEDEEWLPRLDAMTERFAVALETSDPSWPVPACPGWTTAELAQHLGGVHQWARNAVLTSTPRFAAEPAPADPAALPGWYRGHAHALVETLRAVGPDAPAWTFDGPGVAAFWRRRQVLETSMHLWDVVGASGPSVFDSALALDGIDEVVTALFPRQVRLNRMPPIEHAIELRALDGADAVAGAVAETFVLAGDGARRTREASSGEDATVTGLPDVLVLLLWKRIGLADVALHITGNDIAVKTALEAALTP